MQLRRIVARRCRVWPLFKVDIRCSFATLCNAGMHGQEISETLTRTRHARFPRWFWQRINFSSTFA